MDAAYMSSGYHPGHLTVLWILRIAQDDNKGRSPNLVGLRFHSPRIRSLSWPFDSTSFRSGWTCRRAGWLWDTGDCHESLRLSRNDIVEKLADIVSSTITIDYYLLLTDY